MDEDKHFPDAPTAPENNNINQSEEDSGTGVEQQQINTQDAQHAHTAVIIGGGEGGGEHDYRVDNDGINPPAQEQDAHHPPPAPRVGEDPLLSSQLDRAIAVMMEAAERNRLQFFEEAEERNKQLMATFVAAVKEDINKTQSEVKRLAAQFESVQDTLQVSEQKTQEFHSSVTERLDRIEQESKRSVSDDEQRLELAQRGQRQQPTQQEDSEDERRELLHNEQVASSDLTRREDETAAAKKKKHNEEWAKARNQGNADKKAKQQAAAAVALTAPLQQALPPRQQQQRTVMNAGGVFSASDAASDNNDTAASAEIADLFADDDIETTLSSANNSVHPHQFTNNPLRDAQQQGARANVLPRTQPGSSAANNTQFRRAELSDSTTREEIPVTDRQQQRQNPQSNSMFQSNIRRSSSGTNSQAPAAASNYSSQRMPHEVGALIADASIIFRDSKAQNASSALNEWKLSVRKKLRESTSTMLLDDNSQGYYSPFLAEARVSANTARIGYKMRNTNSKTLQIPTIFKQPQISYYNTAIHRKFFSSVFMHEAKPTNEYLFPFRYLTQTLQEEMHEGATSFMANGALVASYGLVIKQVPPLDTWTNLNSDEACEVIEWYLRPTSPADYEVLLAASLTEVIRSYGFQPSQTVPQGHENLVLQMTQAALDHAGIFLQFAQQFVYTAHDQGHNHHNYPTQHPAFPGIKPTPDLGLSGFLGIFFSIVPGMNTVLYQQPSGLKNGDSKPYTLAMLLRSHVATADRTMYSGPMRHATKAFSNLAVDLGIMSGVVAAQRSSSANGGNMPFITSSGGGGTTRRTTAAAATPLNRLLLQNSSTHQQHQQPQVRDREQQPRNSSSWNNNNSTYNNKRKVGDAAADNNGGPAQQKRALIIAALNNMIQHSVSHADEHEATTASGSSDEDEGNDEWGGVAEEVDWGYNSDDNWSEHFDAQELAEIHEHMNSLSVDNTQLAEVLSALVPQREEPTSPRREPPPPPPHNKQLFDASMRSSYSSSQKASNSGKSVQFETSGQRKQLQLPCKQEMRGKNTCKRTDCIFSHDPTLLQAERTKTIAELMAADAAQQLGAPQHPQHQHRTLAATPSAILKREEEGTQHGDGVSSAARSDSDSPLRL